MFKLGDGKGDAQCFVKAIKGIFVQSRYSKEWPNKKNIKDYFKFLLHSLFHDYSGMVYDYN
jgi:hypothetical protein